MINKNRKNIKIDGGQVVIIATLFFLAISLSILMAVSFSVTKGINLARDFEDSRRNLVLSESLAEDIYIRLINNLDLSATETLIIDGHTATAEITDVLNGKTIVVEGNVNDSIRRIEAGLEIGGGISFSLGVMVGNGGFLIGSNAGVLGNVYSNGDIIGTANGAFVAGTAISAGGLIDNLEIGSTTLDEVWANEVTDSTITGSLYCQTGSGNNKSCDTSREDPATTTYPVSQENIDHWETVATEGGTITGDYATPASGSESLGPIKITGNLTISNGSTLTLEGPVWVVGEIIAENNALIKVSTDYGAESEVLFSNGIITLNNNVDFQGSGEGSSYMLLLTTSSSSDAIALQNNVGSVVLNAQNGTITFANNSGAKQATADTIVLEPNATIEYETGLADKHFTSGPSGGYYIENWGEIE